MKSYILLEVEVPEYCSDCGGSDEAHVTSKQFTLEEMLKDVEFRQKLVQNGWADVKAIEGLDKETLGPRLILLNQYGSNGYITGSVVDTANQSTLNQLMANGSSFLAIELGESAVKKLCPEGHAQYEALIQRRKQALKAAEVAAQKRREAAAAKRAQKEANKIEEAKKLLVKAGLKVE